MATSRVDEIQAELRAIGEEFGVLTALGRTGSATEVDERLHRRMKILHDKLELLVEWGEIMERAVARSGASASTIMTPRGRTGR